MKALVHLLASMTIMAIVSICASTVSAAQALPPPAPKEAKLYIITNSATTLVAAFNSRANCEAARASIDQNVSQHAFIYNGNPPMAAFTLCIDSAY
jgi:hypothetical protein